jgi:hypothetical protein
VQVTNTGDLELDHVSTVYCGQGLNVEPQSGQVIELLFCHDSQFDSGSGTGVNLNPASGGTIQLAKFGRVWSCTNANGIVLGGAGSILDTEITDLVGSNNTNDGLAITNTAAVNTRVKGGSFSANANGIVIANGVSKFKLDGVISGACGEFAGNSVSDLDLNGANDLFNVEKCGFTTVAIGSLSAGTPGVTWFIRGNQGLVTQNSGSQTLSSGTTTTVVTHGLVSTPGVQNIRLTPATGLGTAAQYWVSAVSSTTFTISTNVAPGAGVVIAWEARIFGA